MNTFKLLGIATLLISGVAIGAPACTGFKLKLKNTDDMAISKVKLYGAELTPKVVSPIKGRSEYVFKIQNSAKDLPMYGEFVLQTISLPKKTIRIHYTLENKGFVCEHNSMKTYTEIPVNKTRTLNQVAYTITPYKS